MKSRKVLILLTTIAMGAMLVGCGSSKKDSADDSKNTQIVEAETEESGTEESETEESETKESETKDTKATSNTSDDKATDDKAANDTDEMDIEAELAEIEKQDSAIFDKIQKPGVTQTEMNMAANESYKLWDDELNSIWARLENKLSSSEMEELREAQRTWIADKESAIEIAGEECGGGSIQPLIEATKGAELTRERVYELAGLLK